MRGVEAGELRGNEVVEVRGSQGQANRANER